jgi:hypothetical protein
MSWHFSQALVAACSVENDSGGTQDAPWNTAPFAPDDSCSDKMKGTCHRSPFGMMYAPSTDGHGAALLTWFREGSLARTSVPPARVLGWTENDPAFSTNWNGSLAKFDRESFGWKTAQISLITGLSESCVDLPAWGLMRDGVLSAQPQPVQAMYEKGAGYLPTPMASDNRDRGDTTNPSIQRRMHIGKQIGLSMLFKGMPCPSCVEAMMGWPVGWTDSRPLATDKCLAPSNSPTGS